MRCEHCGAECALPFTCQHCGGKFCADCRLPPAHGCTGMQSWKSRPAPGVGTNYSRGGGISATGGSGTVGAGALISRNRLEGLPWLKIMIVVIAIVLLGIAYVAATHPH